MKMKEVLHGLDMYDFEVNICNKAIHEVNPDLRHGDRIIDKDNDKGTVIGVAKRYPINGNGMMIIWCEFDRYPNKVHRGSGLRKIDEEEQS